MTIQYNTKMKIQQEKIKTHQESTYFFHEDEEEIQKKEETNIDSYNNYKKKTYIHT